MQIDSELNGLIIQKVQQSNICAQPEEMVFWTETFNTWSLKLKTFVISMMAEHLRSEAKDVSNVYALMKMYDYYNASKQQSVPLVKW